MSLAKISIKTWMQLETEISEDGNYKSILKAEVCPINPIHPIRITKQLTGFTLIYGALYIRLEMYLWYITLRMNERL